MTKKISIAVFEELLDRTYQHYANNTYGGGYTYPEFIETWIIHDIYVGVLDYLGLEKFDGEIDSRIMDVNTRRELEIDDMIVRYREGGFPRAGYLIRQTIQKTLNSLRSQDKLKESSE